MATIISQGARSYLPFTTHITTPKPHPRLAIEQSNGIDFVIFLIIVLFMPR